MAWDIVASWSSGNLVFSDASGNEICVFNGDSRVFTIPSGAGITMAAGSTFKVNGASGGAMRGRVDLDLTYVGSSGGGGVVNSVANPTTQTIYCESMIVYVETASSSSSFLSAQIATADSSSGGGGNILADATIECTTGGYVASNSSAIFPIAWNATSYLTLYVTSSSDGSAGLDGTVSVFYVTAVTT